MLELPKNDGMYDEIRQIYFANFIPMSKQLEIPFSEYADKTIPIPFEETEEELADALQQEKENSESKKDCAL